MRNVYRSLFFIGALLLPLSQSYAKDSPSKKEVKEERTFAIIKPDAVERNLVGKILSVYESHGFKIAAMKMKKLTRDEAAEFYKEHKGRSFFESTIEFMSSSPVVLLVLKGEEGIIKRHRDLNGATDPKKAKEGSIRKMFAKSVGRNSVHGSDSPKSAEREIHFFFADSEIH